MSWKVPLADIDLGLEEEEAVLRVVRSRWLSMGEETQNFEKEFAEFSGAKHALAVTNATAALHMACMAVNLGPGDEVILPSLTFVATANAVRYTGATPVFADVESEDWLTVSPASIEKCLTEKTRAILIVHYAGYPCDMAAIQAIAKKHNLAILEDSAHTIGSYLDERHLGTFGAVGCFSFFSNKNMTTGEGGMVTTNDDALAEKLRVLRSHGMTSLTWDRHKGHAWSYDVVDLGYNYRIDELRSAIGRAQLKKIPRFNQRRAELTRLYRELLSELAPQVGVPFNEERGVSCHHIMPVLLPRGTDRVQFMEAMKAQGIQTSIHYPPIHHFQNYEGHQEFLRDDLRVTEEVGAREVTLPLYPLLTDEDVRAVAEAVQKSVRG
ncbi:MAG: UDP-4-amino-4-deoxy-L-arabinose--oxoglutarate aminotransferase [Anaerolineales bacterium]|nr:UDP-4-amino-4-deoxy-L-arabinose--oxoglutarate aminotransferase [Anaerolineales bacterium]